MYTREKIIQPEIVVDLSTRVESKDKINNQGNIHGTQKLLW